ncbi:hypothetical protein OSTOST_17705, partial [Ostertagia ostertagi]
MSMHSVLFPISVDFAVVRGKGRKSNISGSVSKGHVDRKHSHTKPVKKVITFTVATTPVPQSSTITNTEIATTVSAETELPDHLPDPSLIHPVRKKHIGGPIGGHFVLQYLL